VTASSTLRTPRTRHCCIVVILPAARELRVRASAERSRRRSLALPMSDPATRSQAARSNRGSILNAVAACPALRPRRRLLAIGNRNLASLDRPSVEDGAADIPDPADQVGDGQILRLDCVAGGCPRNRRGVRLGLFAPAMRAQVQRLSPLPAQPLAARTRSRAGKSLRRRSGDYCGLALRPISAST
jgi:hypothetical protein